MSALKDSGIFGPLEDIYDDGKSVIVWVGDRVKQGEDAVTNTLDILPIAAGVLALAYILNMGKS